MSTTDNRGNGSPASSPSLSNAPSKLPRFLQKQSRDRSKSESVTISPSTPEPKSRRGSKFLTMNKDRKASDGGSTDFAMDDPPIIVEPLSSPPQHQHAPNTSPGPVNIPSPRARTRSEHPAASAPETAHMQTLYASTSSAGGTRIGDLPTRLSGWFAHTFSTSSTDLSLPAILAQHSTSTSRGGSPSGYDSTQSTASPRRLAGATALLAAAKHGKGAVDKAMRYLLDSDAVPDRCGEPIWLLGVRHPGWEGPPPDAPPPLQQQIQQRKESRIKGRRGSWRSSSSSAASSSADGHSSPTSSTGTGQSTASMSASAGPSQGKLRGPPDPGAAWPREFYSDFTSRVWLTYRSHMGTPIRDARLADLPPCAGVIYGDEGSRAGSELGHGGGSELGHAARVDGSRSPTVGRKVWPWAAEKTWSADTGWGCMLRTGQSLLANALVGVLLGRDWRRPAHPVATPDYAVYVRILTWFLDTPDPHAPFSVHRMALAGKELGTDVGQWFGPSVAAGAIKTLVNAFPECGLSVALATDSTLYQSQIFAASHGDASRAPRRQHTATWGERPVLLLLGIRLGIEGVNPIYYETIKMLYTFPQSVGIAGGRPSSSYYFVGSQADSLFYLDPHNPRPAIPLRPPPPRAQVERYERAQERNRQAASARSTATGGRGRTQDREDEDERRSSPERDSRRRPSSATHGQGGHHRVPTSPSSVTTASSTFSYHAPASPSPLAQGFSSSSADSGSSWAASEGILDGNENGEGDGWEGEEGRSPPPAYHQHGMHRLAGASSVHGRAPSSTNDTASAHGGSAPTPPLLDPVQLHYCNAYSAAELRTFHCERVRKMPLSGLDPSMLIGFLCRDEKDWWDFRRRVAELPKTIFSIQEEPPTWPSDLDDDMGLESISEPDELEDGVEVDVDGDGEEQFFDTREEGEGSSGGEQRHHTPSRGHYTDAPARQHSQAGQQRQYDARRSTDTSEEDPADPVTPGPTSRFEIPARKGMTYATGRGDAVAFPVHDDDEEDEEEVEGDDIEDDWVDPSIPTPTGAPSPRAHEVPTATSRPPRERERTTTLAPAPRLPTKDKHASSSSSSKEKAVHTSSSGKTRRVGKQVPVPVPAVRVPAQAVVQEHYPFPVTPAEEQGAVVGGGAHGVERTRSTSGRKTQRMHNARARDGGRTQSGGVKGILADDL